MLGSESAGVPEQVHRRADLRVRIPLRPGLRSLNVVTAAAIVLAEALRQTGGLPRARGRLTETGEADRGRPAGLVRDAARPDLRRVRGDRGRLCRPRRAAELPPGRFERQPWDRPGRRRRRHGHDARPAVFEKVGVNVSTVWGELGPEFRRQIPGAGEDGRFWASGISLVAHLRSPHCPPAHMNTRHIRTSRAWFGGGADLNPIYPDDADTAAFHARLRAACDAYAPGRLRPLQALGRRVFLHPAPRRAARRRRHLLRLPGGRFRAGLRLHQGRSARPSSTSTRRWSAGTWTGPGPRPSAGTSSSAAAATSSSTSSTTAAPSSASRPAATRRRS